MEIYDFSFVTILLAKEILKICTYFKINNKAKEILDLLENVLSILLNIRGVISPNCLPTDN